MGELLGNLIQNTRKTKKIKSKALIEGLCSSSQLTKIESGQKNVDKALRDRILSRLGISNEIYENFLNPDEYEELSDQFKVINFLEDKRLEDAEKIIEEKLMKFILVKKQNVYYQFWMYMNFILSTMKQGIEESIHLLKKAIEITVPNYMDKDFSNMIISSKELFLITEYYKYLYRFDEEKIYFGVLEKAILYIEEKIDIYTSINIYTIYVVELSKKWLEECNYGKILQACNLALKNLNKTKRMHRITEILELKLLALKAMKDISIEEIVLVENQLSVLKGIFKKFDSEKESYIWYPFFTTKNINNAADVVKRRRNMFKMTQEELCSDILAYKSLSRFERKKNSCNKSTLEVLLQRLNIAEEQVSFRIVSDDLEAVQLCNKISEIDSYKEDKAKSLSLVEELEKKIDMRCPKNFQYIEFEKAVHGSLSDLEKLEKLKKSIKNTIDIDEDLFGYLSIKEVFLTNMEILILLQILQIDERIGKKDMAIKVADFLYEYLKEKHNFAMLEVYIDEMIAINCANFYSNIGLFEKAEEILNFAMYQTVKYRRTHVFINLYARYKWNSIFQKWNESIADDCDEKFISSMRECMCLAELLDSQAWIDYTKKICK